MAVEDFKGVEGWTKPISRAVGVTASANKLADGLCRAIYLGTSGDLTVTFLDESSVTLHNLAAGVWHPIAVTHITAISNATNVRVGY